MLSKSQFFIEIGHDYSFVWEKRQKKISLAEQIVMLENNIWEIQTLSEVLSNVIKKIAGSNIVFLLNTSRSNVSLLDELVIPKYFSSEKYINSHNKLKNGLIWLTTVPELVSSTLLEACQINKINQNRIQAVNTLEYCMACYYEKLLEATWLFIPQGDGLRLIIIEAGMIGISACYFFSNNPNFREKELKRICLHREQIPKKVDILTGLSDYRWLEIFMLEKYNIKTTVRDAIETRREMFNSLY